MPQGFWCVLIGGISHHLVFLNLHLLMRKFSVILVMLSLGLVFEVRIYCFGLRVVVRSPDFLSDRICSRGKVLGVLASALCPNLVWITE